jgi:hypothetical protein
VKVKPIACVYFFQMMVGDNPIKIGSTGDVDQRYHSLKCMLPYEIKVLGILEKRSFDVERRLHQRFAASRLKGEWFRPAPDLLRFIEERTTSWVPPSAFVQRPNRDWENRDPNEPDPAFELFKVIMGDNRSRDDLTNPSI